jgi:S-adenosylmethionine hydrolase
MDHRGVERVGALPQRTISLLTDFGHEAGYVGMMKGVILSINPRVRLVDLGHEVRPQDIRQAAFLLRVAVPHFPPGTIHVVVVDPGVGTERRVLAVRSGDAYFVGPDNGVLSWAIGPEGEGVSVDREDLYRKPASATFHGRDRMAPVAAHLSLGMPLDELGSRVSGWVELLPPRLETEEGRIVGEVLDVDRFGNLVTSIPGSLLSEFAVEDVSVQTGSIRIRGVKRTFGDGEAGSPIAYVGSTGFLEIARVGGSAADSGCGLGSPVSLWREHSGRDLPR